MQASWHTFLLDDSTLTRNKFNYYMGWQVSLEIRHLMKWQWQSKRTFFIYVLYLI